MQFFHLDRLDSFPANKREQLEFFDYICNTDEARALFVQLYPDGISKTGKRYLTSFDIKTVSLDELQETFNNSTVYTKEYAFEMVRLTLFPNLPSRFVSLFTCESKEDLRMWANILESAPAKTSKASVKVIETYGDFFIGDANWRDQSLVVDNCGPVFSPFSYHAWAKNYWSGNLTNTPKREVLCRLPVSVKDSIPISDFIRSM